MIPWMRPVSSEVLMAMAWCTLLLTPGSAHGVLAVCRYSTGLPTTVELLFIVALHILEESLLGLPGILSGTVATAPNDGMLQRLAALLDT